METLAFHLPNVDATKQQAFATDVSKQSHVHPVGGFGFAVEAGDEVQSRKQFGQASFTTHAAVFVDESNRRLELGGVAVEPVRFVNAGVGRFQTEREHGAVGEGFHQRLGDRFGGLHILCDDRRVAVVGVEDAKPLVLSQPVKQLGNGFGVWNGVFQFTNALGHVGVGIGHAAQTDMVYARIVSEPYFLDNVLRRSPNRDTFLWLDAKLASPLVAHAALIDLHFIRERAGQGFASEVGMVGDRFARSTGLCPRRPLLGRSPLVLPPLYRGSD